MKEFYKKYQDIIKLVVAFLIFYLIGTVLVMIIKAIGIDFNKYYYPITLFVNIVRALIIALIFRKDLVKDFKKFKKNFWEYNDIAVKYWLVGLVVMCVSNLIIGRFAPGGMPSNEQGVREIIKSLSYASIILTGITAPIAEELLFRKAIKNVVPKKWPYILTSGIIFGAAHIVTKGSPLTLYDYLYLIPYSSLGIAFAFTCHKTDNVFPSMLVHSLHNIAITLAAILMGSNGILL